MPQDKPRVELHSRVNNGSADPTPRDQESLHSQQLLTDRRDRIAFLTNYAVIALLNAPQFALTIYGELYEPERIIICADRFIGRRKLDTDANYDETNGEYDDYLFDNWNGLKLCLAVVREICANTLQPRY